MSKQTPSPSRSRKGSLVPPSLRPFPFADKQESVQEEPTSGKGSRGDASTLVPLADVVWPRAPGHEMSASDAERRARLQCLIAIHQSGKEAKSKDIKLAITADEWARYEREYQMLRHQPGPTVVPRHISSLFKEYNAELGRGDRLASRAARGGSSTARSVKRRHFRPIRETSLCNQAESAYEHALELLQELFELNPGIGAYLDRPVRFGQVEGTATLEPDGMPRLITSRSKYARNDGKSRKAERSLKLSTLMESLHNLDRPPETGRLVGIGDAPVIPGSVDQWIFSDFEWRLI